MTMAQKSKHASSWRRIKRLLGRILVDGGFITDPHLAEALASQREKNERLGETLVRMGALNPAELKAVLSFQRDLASLDDSVKAAGGVRETHLRLGEIMVATEQITPKELEDVLARQKISKKKIGKLLVEAGYAQGHQIDFGLKLQQKLVTAALLAALSMADVSGVREARAGDSPGSSASAKINITARVLERTSMRIISQVEELVVRNPDIMRGYVEIPAASRIHVKSNNSQGYLLMFEFMSGSDDFFDSVNVVVGGREVQLSPGGGWVPQPFVRGGTTLDVSYRFVLSKDAQAGTYGWPLRVSVTSM